MGPLPSLNLASTTKQELDQTFSFGGNAFTVPTRSAGSTGFSLPTWGWAGLALAVAGLVYLALKRGR